MKKQKGKPPAFQFYPSDFISDENVIMMSNQEVGCYIKLLCFQWKQRSIPDDIDKIARLCNEDSETMAKLWKNIKSCFKSNGHGRLVNPRLVKEWQKLKVHHENKKKAGKLGAEKRWGNKGLNSTPKSLPMAKDSSSFSSSSSSSIKDKTVRSKRGSKRPSLTQVEKAIKDEFEEWWKTWPRKVKKQAAKKAYAKGRRDNNMPKVDELIDITKKHIELFSERDDPRFIPHPATWLNACQWTDELGEGGEDAFREFYELNKENDSVVP